MSRIATLLFLLVLIETSRGQDYDPLLVDKSQVEHRDLTIKDTERSREIPIRVYLQENKQSVPVVLFSHGLGGSRAGSAFLGKHWASRGYVAVFLQHPGSDDGVWKDVPIGRKMAAMKKAASPEEFLKRVKDVPAVLDQLEKWNEDSSHEWKGLLDLKRVGMSGHSFGAVTTQAVSGQKHALGNSLTDPRIQAAVIMSPSGPAGGNTKHAFGSVSIPWMLLTGTKDAGSIVGIEAKDRLVVFPDLPSGSKYQLVLDNAEHSVFTDRKLLGETEQRNPNHHRAILAVSTAFWDAYLRNDEAARSWLDSDKVRNVLESGDDWQTK